MNHDISFSVMFNAVCERERLSTDDLSHRVNIRKCLYLCLFLILLYPVNLFYDFCLYPRFTDCILYGQRVLHNITVKLCHSEH